MPVFLDVGLCRFRGMMGRMEVVPMRGVGMMCGFFMLTRFVMMRRLLVVTGGVLMVLSCLMMMLCCVFGHEIFPL
ncbi:MAG TPA: hypothetical protein VKV95_13360 [Terriglobia bacterium]|nr:hypothetical protein [Terriglobia bacterium]